MRIGNLKGLATAILADSRPVANPWGIVDSKGMPFTAIILRGNHDDWTSFVAENDLNDPQTKKRRKAHLKAALSQSHKGRGRRGGENPDKLIDRLADDLVEHAVDAGSLLLKKERRKEGASRILFQGGFGIEDENGQPIDLDLPDNRLALLNLNYVDGEPFAITAPYLYEWVGEWDDSRNTWKPGGFYRIATDPDDADLPEDERAKLLNPYKDVLFGDAILMWAEDEADETERFYKKRVEVVLGNSVPSPAGSTTTGSVVMQASEGASNEP